MKQTVWAAHGPAIDGRKFVGCFYTKQEAEEFVHKNIKEFEDGIYIMDEYRSEKDGVDTKWEGNLVTKPKE